MMVPLNINEAFAIRVYIIMCLGGHAPAATLIFTVISEGVLICARYKVAAMHFGCMTYNMPSTYVLSGKYIQCPFLLVMSMI